MTRAMKDSGIEWLGKIPENWSVDKLNRIFHTITDFVASGSFADLAKNVKYLDTPDYAQLVRTTDISGKGYSSKPVYIDEASYNYLRNSNLYGGEIILPNIGGVGEVYIVPKLYKKMSLAPNSIMLRTNQINKFYYYYFASQPGGESLLSITGSTAQPKFNKTSLKQIKLPKPSIDAQQKIADFLDEKCGAIDEIISKTEQSIEEYKKLKQSVITKAVTKGIRPNRTMQDSNIEWIGEIPENWEIRKIKYLFIVLSGATPATSHPEFWNGTEIWITPADYKTTDKFIFKGSKNISNEGAKSCGLTKIPVNNIIFSKRAPIGTVAINCVELYTNQGCLGCICKNCDTVFYYYVFIAFIEQFNLLGTGTTFKEISLKNFINFLVPLPPLSEQKEIAYYLDEKCTDIDTIIKNKQEVIKKLEDYKKSMIYEYVTGKKEV